MFANMSSGTAAEHATHDPGSVPWQPRRNLPSGQVSHVLQVSPEVSRNVPTGHAWQLPALFIPHSTRSNPAGHPSQVSQRPLHKFLRENVKARDVLRFKGSGMLENNRHDVSSWFAVSKAAHSGVSSHCLAHSTLLSIPE